MKIQNVIMIDADFFEELREALKIAKHYLPKNNDSGWNENAYQEGKAVRNIFNRVLMESAHDPALIMRDKDGLVDPEFGIYSK